MIEIYKWFLEDLKFLGKIITHDGSRVSDCIVHSSKVSLRCSQRRGDQLNWDQPFTVSASCDQCDAAPRQIHFSWSLYLVQAASKPVLEGNKDEICTGTTAAQRLKIPHTSLLL